MTAPTADTQITRSTSTSREIAKCPKCKRAVSRLVVREIVRTTRWGLTGMRTSKQVRVVSEGHERTAISCCGVLVPFWAVKGTTNDTPCDARCTSATGHKCECSCGGRNHGADHG